MKQRNASVMGDAAMSYYMPDKSIYKVNLQLDNDSFPLIKDHDFDWTIDDDAMMWHAMMIADPLKSVSKGSSACLIYNSIVLEIYRHVLYKYTLFKNFFIALCTAVHFITHIYLLITDTPSTSILMSMKWNAWALRQNFEQPLTETNTAVSGMYLHILKVQRERTRVSSQKRA